MLSEEGLSLFCTLWAVSDEGMNMNSVEELGVPIKERRSSAPNPDVGVGLTRLGLVE